MTPGWPIADTLRAPSEAEQGAELAKFAASFALREPIEAEALLESLCCDAVREWRLTDATFWQRVKFRARLLRAMAALPLS